MLFSRCWKSILYALLLSIAGASDATAGVLTLQWDPSPDSSVAGYTVYVGTESGQYSSTFNVGNQLRFVFPDAQFGKQYYFAVAAYTSANILGPLSAEVSGRVDASLQLSNPGDVTSLAGQPATVQLRASASGTGALTYDATGLPLGVTIDAATGLISGTPRTEGSYRVTAMVASGLTAASESFLWTVTRHQSETPAVVITVPTSGSSFTTSKSSVVLGGVAMDDEGVVAVHWKNDRGGSGRATGTDTWLAAVPLRPGRNEVTLVVVDGNSNRSSINVSIYRTETVQPLSRNGARLGPRVE
jgi:hypothetical protein